MRSCASWTMRCATGWAPAFGYPAIADLLARRPPSLEPPLAPAQAVARPGDDVVDAGAAPRAATPGRRAADPGPAGHRQDLHGGADDHDARPRRKARRDHGAVPPDDQQPGRGGPPRRRRGPERPAPHRAALRRARPMGPGRARHARDEPDAAVAALADGANVIAGTSWLLARPELERKARRPVRRRGRSVLPRQRRRGGDVRRLDRPRRRPEPAADGDPGRPSRGRERVRPGASHRPGADAGAGPRALPRDDAAPASAGERVRVRGVLRGPPRVAPRRASNDRRAGGCRRRGPAGRRRRSLAADRARSATRRGPPRRRPRVVELVATLVGRRQVLRGRHGAARSGWTT